MVGLININKKYNDKDVLKNINYTFKDKGLYLIKGVSGSGKTTLLNIIARRCNDFKGELIVNGDVFYLSFNNYLIGEFTVKENIELHKCIFINFKEYDYRFNIDDLLNKKVNKLSMGEKQRVGIFLALSSNSKIILLDEPLAGVDSLNKKKIIKELKKVSKKRLIILASHLDISCNVIEIVEGKIVENVTKIEQKQISRDRKCKNIHRWCLLLHTKQFFNRIMFVLSLFTILIMYTSFTNKIETIDHQFINSFSNKQIYYKKNNKQLNRDVFYDEIVSTLAYETSDYFYDIYFENMYEVEVKTNKKYIGNGSVFSSIKEIEGIKDDEIILNLNINDYCKKNNYSVCVENQVEEELIGDYLFYTYGSKYLKFKIVGVSFGELNFIYVNNLNSVVDNLIQLNNCRHYFNYYLVIYNEKLSDFNYKIRNNKVINRYEFIILESNDNYTYVLLDNSHYIKFSDEELSSIDVVACSDIAYSCNSFSFSYLQSLYYLNNYNVQGKIKYENINKELKYNEVVISSSLAKYLNKGISDYLKLSFYFDNDFYNLDHVEIVEIIDSEELVIYHNKYDYELFKDIFNKYLDVYYVSGELDFPYNKQDALNYEIISNAKSYLNGLFNIIMGKISESSFVMILILFLIESNKIKKHYDFFNLLKNNNVDFKYLMINYFLLYFIIGIIFVNNLYLFTIYECIAVVFYFRQIKKIKSR